MKQDKHLIEITGSFEPGSEGVDRDEKNPLSRALDRLLTTGKPLQKLTNCFLIDDTGVWRWFGVFGLSEGERVLFFPGFGGSYDQTSAHVRDEKGLREPGSKSMEIDHVSLEKGLSSTHFTSARSKKHLGSFSILSLGGGRHLWFGLSARNSGVFRPLVKETKAVASAPGTDSKRRVDEFQKTIAEQIFQGLELPCGARSQPGFPHFSVVAGLRGFPDYIGTELAFPFGSPDVEDSFAIPDGFLPARRHRISLGPVDLMIVTTWLPGRLKADATFTGTLN